MSGAVSHTFRDGGSEIVPSQEAAVISEGSGTGASGPAVWSPRDVAVAMVIAVIHRTEMVLAEYIVLQSCNGSMMGDEQPAGA